jgi:LPXTG-motif cell wall-anchored protein
MNSSSPNKINDQNSAGTAADQNAGSNNSNQGGSLPQTGSELPLLGLLGAGTLSAGVWKAYLRRK